MSVFGINFKFAFYFLHLKLSVCFNFPTIVFFVSHVFQGKSGCYKTKNRKPHGEQKAKKQRCKQCKLSKLKLLCKSSKLNNICKLN